MFYLCVSSSKLVEVFMAVNKRIAELLSGTAGQLGGSTAQPMMINNPLVLIFGADDKLICHIHPREGDDHRLYGLMICDLVRHLANAFKVDEDDVWEWVDKERERPTTEVKAAN